MAITFQGELQWQLKAAQDRVVFRQYTSVQVQAEIVQKLQQ